MPQVRRRELPIRGQYCYPSLRLTSGAPVSCTAVRQAGWNSGHGSQIANQLVFGKCIQRILVKAINQLRSQLIAHIERTKGRLPPKWFVRLYIDIVYIFLARLR